MTIELPENLERSIRAEVDRGQFASVEDAVAEMVRAYFAGKPQPPSAPGSVELGTETDLAAKPIWEEILDSTADVPDEEWNRLPPDLAEQHDHYLYGTPKRPVP